MKIKNAFCYIDKKIYTAEEIEKLYRTNKMESNKISKNLLCSDCKIAKIKFCLGKIRDVYFASIRTTKHEISCKYHIERMTQKNYEDILNLEDKYKDRFFEINKTKMQKLIDKIVLKNISETTLKNDETKENEKNESYFFSYPQNNNKALVQQKKLKYNCFDDNDTGHVANFYGEVKIKFLSKKVKEGKKSYFVKCIIYDKDEKLITSTDLFIDKVFNNGKLFSKDEENKILDNGIKYLVAFCSFAIVKRETKKEKVYYNLESINKYGILEKIKD